MRLNKQPRRRIATMLAVAATMVYGVSTLHGYDGPAERLLAEGRNLYYQSVEEESMIQTAIDKFEALKSSYPSFTGRAEVYIGALYAIRAKHVFLPNEKLSWANQGLARIDAGLRKAPNDIEALFVHGSVCHQLPFFFNRGDDAESDFDRIIALLPNEHSQYDRTLVNDIFNFLIKNADLSDAKLLTVKGLRTRLGYN